MNVMAEDKKTGVEDADGRMLIDGVRVAARSGKRSTLVNPSTGKSSMEVAYGDAEDIDAAVAVARGAFDSGIWSRARAEERAKILWRMADLIDANADALARADTEQMGMPFAFSKVMVGHAAEAFRYYAGWCTKIQGPSSDISGQEMMGFTYTRAEPVGVAGLIVPWNAPMLLTSWKIATSLAAGCTSVVKPSEETPLTALALAELLLEAGLPKGVVNVVTGGGEAGAHLAAHRDVDKISFTGSTATGRKIIQASAGNLKRVTLELGGKSPCVILADADLAKAVPAAAQAMYFNSGQVCTAGQRLFVQRPVYEQVVAEMVQIANGIKVGNPYDADTVMGPLVSGRQFGRVCELIESARKDGVTIRTGGEKVEGEGFFFRPTVMTEAGRDARVMREEIFGPAICIVPFDDPDTLLEEINDTEYGLSAYIWTRDIERAHRLAAQIQSGVVWINSGGLIDYRVPMGGFKASGWGRENGAKGLEAFLETKTVIVTL
ncbi:aldehyde dehydrogenase (NAD+) [Sphingobium faniae]|nr:aldehyde dehydrogenase (NAD+) [Sphingobium faniae]